MELEQRDKLLKVLEEISQILFSSPVVRQQDKEDLAEAMHELKGVM